MSRPRPSSWSYLVLGALVVACGEPSPMAVPDAAVPDAAVPLPDASDPLPDAAIPHDLRAELTALGPLVGGRMGPIAMLGERVVVASPAGLLAWGDARFQWMAAPAECPLASGVGIEWMARVGDLLAAYCGQRMWTLREIGGEWSAVSEAGAAAPPFASNGTTIFALDPTGAIVRWSASAPRWSRVPDFGFGSGHAVSVLAADDTRLYAFASRFGLELALGDPEAVWQPVRGLAEGAYASMRMGLAEEGAYATLQNGGPVFLVRREADGSWVEVGEASEERFGTDVVDVLVDGSRVLVASRAGLFESFDRGETWRLALDAPFVSRGDALLRTPGSVLAASGQGMWAEARGWNAMQLSVEPILAAHATREGVVASMRDVDGYPRGVSGAGGTWEPLDAPGLHGQSHVVLGDELFVVWEGQVWASTDGGRAFERRADAGAESTLSALLVVDDALVALRRLGSARSLVRSTDGARTWADAGGFPDSWRTPRQLVMRDDGWLLELSGDGVHRSTDEGASWSRVDASDDELTALTAAGDVVLAARRDGGIARSIDLGASWQATGLEGLAVSAIAARGSLVVAGVGSPDRGEGGLYYSLDGGTTWAPLEARIPGLGAEAARVSSLSLVEDTLIVGTLDAGVWSVRLLSR